MASCGKYSKVSKYCNDGIAVNANNLYRTLHNEATQLAPVAHVTKKKTETESLFLRGIYNKQEGENVLLNHSKEKAIVVKKTGKPKPHSSSDGQSVNGEGHFYKGEGADVKLIKVDCLR